MNTSQKILICGFPHCGTTILKSIIGHIEDLEEIYNENEVITKNSDKKFILAKYPFTKECFFGEEYKNYIKIFIIRNPLFVFSSINKRFGKTTVDNHNFASYIKTLKKFIKYKTNPEKNIYTIRYEDLFKNNYEHLRNLLDKIGLEYNDEIFNNTKFTNISHAHINIKSIHKKPQEHIKEHEFYRTWQINQPFVSNNDISKIDLNEDLIEEIVNNPYVLQIYPDIKSAFLNVQKCKKDYNDLSYNLETIFNKNRAPIE